MFEVYSSSTPGEVANLCLPGPGSGKFKLRGVTHVEMLCFLCPNHDEVWAFLKNQDGWMTSSRKTRPGVL